MDIIQTQCKKSSRNVKNFKEIKKLIPDMYKLCFKKIGNYPSSIALSHCQVDHEDPKRFFITKTGSIVINPKILMASDPSYSKEGCMSYAYRPIKKVKRYNTLQVTYFNEKWEEKNQIVEGLLAHVFQHEIDHMNGIAIYS